MEMIRSDPEKGLECRGVCGKGREGRIKKKEGSSWREFKARAGRDGGREVSEVRGRAERGE